MSKRQAIAWIVAAVVGYAGYSAVFGYSFRVTTSAVIIVAVGALAYFGVLPRRKS